MPDIAKWGTYTIVFGPGFIVCLIFHRCIRRVVDSVGHGERHHALPISHGYLGGHRRVRDRDCTFVGRL